MKKLILVNGQFINKTKLLAKIKVWTKDEEIIILENQSGNLLNACHQFLAEFKTDKYQQACIIWVTGVTFTNLLTKKLLNKQIVTVQSLSYLERIQEEQEIDILVLGHDVLGQKNLQIILEKFLTKENK